MINLLLTILVLSIVFGLLGWLITTLPLPSPWNVVARAVLVLVAVLVLLSLIFGGIPAPHLVGVR